MKKYYVEDSDGVDMEVPKNIILGIIKDHAQTTYYWTVGILCMIIGFLLGVIA
jgi:hypothetical protein